MRNEEEQLRPTRRAQIVQAATRVLTRAGLHGLTMQAIAQEAGVPKSVVLYHVRDRQGLLLLLAEHVAQLRLQLDAPLETQGGDPRQHLGHWLTGLFEAIQAPDSPLRLLWAVRLDAEGQTLEPLRTPLEKREIWQLSTLLQRGHSQACWHAPDATRLAQALKALTDGFLLQALLVAHDAQACRKLLASCRGAVMDLLVR